MKIFYILKTVLFIYIISTRTHILERCDQTLVEINVKRYVTYVGILITERARNYTGVSITRENASATQVRLKG